MRARSPMRLTPLIAAGALVAAGLVLPPEAAAAPVSGTGPVVSGQARFEVLSPTLIRMEYAADGVFVDEGTFTVPSRDPHSTTYQLSRSNGDLILTTSKLTLRYREGSGRLAPDNLSVSLSVAGTPVTARPAFPKPTGTCAFGTGCEAEDGRLSGGQSVNIDHDNYTGRGFSAEYGQVGARSEWTVTGVPAAGDYLLQVRYANGFDIGRTLSATVGTSAAGRVSMPSTAGWDDWRIAAVPVRLQAGDNRVALRCGADDGCNVNLDSIAVTRDGADYPTAFTTTQPAVDEPGQLGGWTRGLDAYTNQAGADVDTYGLHPGILNTRGWSLLDDTATALRTADGWAKPRPERTGAYQDGYFFGYGHDYKQALRDLRTLTGPAPMLPLSTFGVWYSAYQAYTDRQYREELLPAFRSNGVPLDMLSVDTDWKVPQHWNGWNWNPALFPDPQGFLDWAAKERIAVSLNTHEGIDRSDPKFAAAQATAKNKLAKAAQCFSPDCYRFDWADRDQSDAWFGLHEEFAKQGVGPWWFDNCCTNSVVDMPGLPQDSWVNELYAKYASRGGKRGSVLSRSGASFEDYRGITGAWGEHRSTVQFTGDTRPTWETLAFEVGMTPAAAAVGQPYVSHDIGSFTGHHLPDDLYARWVQFGAFQPVLRLHSDHGDRLPWQYESGRAAATAALKLREALVPYTYSLAWEAHRTGLPIARPLWLEYPEVDEAYTHAGEYLYGPDVLVAPVTTGGAVAEKKVWFPPGTWTDYFTGATFVGPSTATVTVPLDRMPVYVRAGGIVPLVPRTDHVDPNPATVGLKVVSGETTNRFVLHTDAGEGLGYTTGASADFAISYTGGASAATVRIGTASHTYPGSRATRSYTLDLVNTTRPSRVTVDGTALAEISATATGTGWWYESGATTLHVRTAALGTGTYHLIEQTGGSPVSRPESAAVTVALDPPATLRTEAATVVRGRVTNAGPGAVSGTQARLQAPSGWTVAPGAGVSVGTLEPGASAPVTWTVTARAAAATSTASLRAEVGYTSAASGSAGSASTYADVSVVSPGEHLGGLADPRGDDHGPGGYRYPTDPAFAPGAFDLTDVDVYRSGDTVRIVTRVDGDLTNPWDGDQLSVQRLHLYLKDSRQTSTAGTPLLPGSNMVAAGPWARAIVVDGRHRSGTYGQAVYAPDGRRVADAALSVAPDRHDITISVPASAFGDLDPATAGYQVSMFSDADDGEGVGNIRPVYAQACWDGGNGCPWFVKAYRAGGGAGDCDAGLASRDTDTRDPNAMDIISGGTAQSTALDWTRAAPVRAPYVGLSR